MNRDELAHLNDQLHQSLKGEVMRFINAAIGPLLGPGESVIIHALSSTTLVSPVGTGFEGGDDGDGA